MTVSDLLREVENRGVALAGVGNQLRFRPASALTPELVEGLRKHKAEILERLEGNEEPNQNLGEVSGREEPGLNSGPVLKPIIRGTGEAHEPLLNNTVIRGVGEVLELARTHFGELEHPEDPPYPPHEGNGDPMVWTHTAKAQFFRGVRRRDRERRRRDGLPPWIRLVDGGGAA